MKGGILKLVGANKFQHTNFFGENT